MTVPHMENAAPDATRSGVEDASDRTSQRVSGYHSESGSPSPLDRPLSITRWDDTDARSKRKVRSSLRDLADKLGRREWPDKSAMPLLKLAMFGDDATPKGSLRHNANVLGLDGIEGDYDGERMSVIDAKARLLRAGIAALLYTSPSHRPDAPRWRILCPTSRTLEPVERSRLIARVNGVLDGGLSAESFTLSQSYYFGRVTGQPAPEVVLVEGRPIDMADDLDAGSLDKRRQPYGAPANDIHEPADDDLRGEPDVARISAALDAIPPRAIDGYHAWLQVGMALHSAFDGDAEGMELWDGASQWTAGYDRREIEAKWESFGGQSGKPVGIGSLFRLAKEHGWTGKAVPPRRTAGRLTFETPGECEAAPAREYLVKRLLAQRDFAMIYGIPGGGKSTLAPYLAFQVALGLPAFGLRTKPGGVFYVSAEDTHGMRARFRALKRRQGDAPSLKLVGGVSDLLDEKGPNLEELRAAIEAERPALVIIDTLAVAFRGLEENDSTAMGRVNAICRGLTWTGAAVCLIHHGTKADGSTPRGHGSLWGELDVAILLHPADSDGVVRGELRKNRNGPPDLNIAFRIISEELGIDEDGDAITAAIAEEVTSAPVPRRERLSPAERAALSKLIELEANGDVTEDAWRKACLNDRRVSGSEDQNSRRRALRRAVQGLAQKGRITISGDHVSAGEAFESEDYDAER